MADAGQYQSVGMWYVAEFTPLVYLDAHTNAKNSPLAHVLATFRNVNAHTQGFVSQP
jgi:hypothetical protein